MNKIGKLHYISCPRGMLKPCRQMSKKRNTGYDFALNESKRAVKWAVKPENTRLDYRKLQNCDVKISLLQNRLRCGKLKVQKKFLLCSWWCSILNHSILYGIARSFCGCQASFISGRQKQSVASNPPCTCRFIKWHHTASWDFLFYGKFSKTCEFACPTSAFMILSHSRKQTAYALMVKRLRRRPLTAESGVRFPMRVPKKCSESALFLLPRRGTKKVQ